MPSERPELPPGLDLLWGRRPSARRGPKPSMSIDVIVAAAIRVADAEGLDAVSMARVAKEVGFTTMSLYRYLNSKDELLQLMWNGSAQGVQDLILTGEGWRSKLRMWVLAQREFLDRHPWITQMPMATPPVAPNSLAFVERGLETLDDTALPDYQKLRFIGLLSSYTLSEARMAHDATVAARAQAAGGGRHQTWTFETLLRELVDERTYPRLHRIAWSPLDDSSGEPNERTEFLFGVERILDGIQVLVDAAAPPRSRRKGT